MKGQISRYSHRRPPEAAYSGVYLQQGRMVTDADQVESTEIHKGRVDGLGDAAVASGSPAKDGAIGLDGTLPRLRPGLVFVDGIRGEVRPDDGYDTLGAGPLDLYAHQADFQQAPPLAGPALVYVDLWERPVYPAMDPGLVDPALHGADTAFRTRTVAQLRLAPPGTALGSGAYPPHGTAELAAKLREAQAEADPCDPCATELDLPVRAGNMLFRLEVLHVEGPADAPTEVVFAWSAENASELYPADDTVPPEFKRPEKVYEFLSEVSESHQGAFADPATRKRSDLRAGYPPAVPARTDGLGGAWPYVRRWDGAVAWTPAGDGLALVNEATGESVAKDGDALVFTLDKLELRLQVAGKSFLAGDYWFVTVREFAEEAERVQVDTVLPHGIRHHYLALFEIDDAEDAIPVDDPRRRQLSFPALTDLPASHVSFVNTCPKLYGPPDAGGAETVQEALDRLCEIEAADVAFTSNCDEIFGDAATVQEALDKICDLDFTAEIFRYLVGCGILCGFEVRCLPEKPTAIVVRPGAFHDGTGRVFRLREERVLDTLEMAPDPDPDGGYYCLRARVTGAQSFDFELVLQDRQAEEKAPRDDFLSRIQACEKVREIQETVLKKFGKAEQEIIRTAVAFALSGTFPGKPFPSTAAQHETLARFYKQVRAGLDIFASCDIAEDLDDFPTFPRGRPTQAQLGRNMGEVNRALRSLEEAVRAAERDCLCAATVVPCPDEEPCVVEIARIIVTPNGVGDICLQCCRDTALTFRTIDYWLGSLYDDIQAFLVERFCTIREPAGQPPPEKGGSIGVKDGLPYLDAARFKQRHQLKPTTFGPATASYDLAASKGLTAAEAQRLYADRQIEVVGTFDLDGDEIETLPKPDEELAAGLAFKYGDVVEPGDRVALLTRDGKVEGFRLISKGRVQPGFGEVGIGRAGGGGVAPGALQEAVDKAVADKLPEVAVDLGAAKQEAAALEAERAELAGKLEAMRGELQGLEDKRSETAGALRNELESLERKRSDALSAMRGEIDGLERKRSETVSGLRSEIDSLERKRSELGGALESATAELNRMNREVASAREEAAAAQRAAETARAETKAASEELVELQRTAEKNLTELRRAQPVAVLTSRSDVNAALGEAGIGTVADLADMDARRWATVRRRLDLSNDEANALRERARMLSGRTR